MINPKRFKGWGLFSGLWVLFVAAGVASFVYQLKQGDSQRAWADFLVGYFFWACIAMAGIFFSSLQYLTGSYWSTPVRRVAEAFVAYLPVSLVLFGVLIWGLPHLYEWVHLDKVKADPLLQDKASYLNSSLFMVRHGVLYLVVFFLGGWIVRNSLLQDKTGDFRLTQLNTKISAPFIFLFGWLFTFASFDLMMSLSPHWFSTIFGIYCWSGLFYSGLAMITLLVIWLKKQGVLSSYVREDHLHDLGKLMFAFTVFWGYIGLSQFLLIWYANLPEETSYFLTRMQGGWEQVSIALMVVKFGFPFFALLSRPVKRSENFLIFMCLWFFVGQWLDIYWMVFPTFYSEPIFGWQEVGVFLGFAGLFFLSVGSFLKRVNPIAIQDPRLPEGLHHHQ